MLRFQKINQNFFKKQGLAMTWDILIYIICILILVSIVLSGAYYFIQGSRISKTRAETAQIASAISQYHMEIGSLPTNIGEVRSNLISANGQYGPWILKPNTDKAWQDAWGRSYLYKVTNAGSSGAPDYRSFVFYSVGPNGRDESNANNGISGDDIGFWGK
ncbi:MAG: type II secretion system protein GspG [Selenomonadaceae bacterium]|nr:type II secretion system protein GspG [Selenomonadaceae bacterium]